MGGALVSGALVSMKLEGPEARRLVGFLLTAAAAAIIVVWGRVVVVVLVLILAAVGRAKAVVREVCTVE